MNVECPDAFYIHIDLLFWPCRIYHAINESDAALLHVTDALVEEALFAFLLDIGKRRTNLGPHILDRLAMDWTDIALMLIQSAEDLHLPIVPIEILLRHLDVSFLELGLESCPFGVDHVLKAFRCSGWKKLLDVVGILPCKIIGCREKRRRGYNLGLGLAVAFGVVSHLNSASVRNNLMWSQ